MTKQDEGEAFYQDLISDNRKYLDRDYDKSVAPYQFDDPPEPVSTQPDHDSFEADEKWILGILIVIVVAIAIIITGSKMSEAAKQHEQQQQAAAKRVAETSQPITSMKIPRGYIETHEYNGHTYIVSGVYDYGGGMIHDPDCVCGNGGTADVQIQP